VAHTCDLSYSGGRDQENCGSKPARVNSLQDPISKKTLHKKKKEKEKKIGLVEWLKVKALSSSPCTKKKKKKEKNLITFALAVCFPWTLLSWVGIG
jgi:hypothetical protein